MLKDVLAITGKPGLFKIVAHSGKSLIVEEIVNGKRFPISPRDRVVSLGDIAMYTESDDKPLGEILDIIYKTEKGKKIDIKEVISNSSLKDEFGKFISDYDKERVHDSDIKKLFTWYNLLVDKGYTKFTKEEEEIKKDEEDKKGQTDSNENK